jgi:hypothetical protein
MEDAVGQYFLAWNSKDAAGLSECFDPDVELKDWEVSLEGRDAVVKGNIKIWEAYPDIKITVTSMSTSCGERTVATCELDVELNDSTKTILKVVDLIEFSQPLKITSIRAYKQ